MSSGNWLNKDGLFLQFGTAKATAVDGGEFKSYGANRIVEVLIDLSKLNTSTATIVDYNTFFPSMANFVIEKVELLAEVAMSTTNSPTLSVGVIKASDQSTVPTNGATAFVNALAASSLAGGDLVTLTVGSTGAGSYIGDYEDTTNLTYPTNITATLGTATATGKIRVRIHYHGVGTIPN